MQYDRKGRLAQTVEEAENYIRHFIHQTQAHSEERFARRQMEYDLYLPWLAEVVENIRLPEDVEPTPTNLLERLYMEAAWALVMAGYLRPGPKKVGFDNARDCYGKGFSLTLRGEEWIRSYPIASNADTWPEILKR